MGKDLKTNIHITGTARDAYDRMSARYSAKTAVSAGIMLLARLKADDRERIIDEANGQAAREDEAAAARDTKTDKRKKARQKPAKAIRMRQRRLVKTQNS